MSREVAESLDCFLGRVGAIWCSFMMVMMEGALVLSARDLEDHAKY